MHRPLPGNGLPGQTVRGGRDRADLLAFGDLVQQLWQNGAIAVAAGRELYRPDVGSGGVHRQMHLAACKQTVAGQRLASALNAVFTRLPFAVAQELDAGAVHQQVQGAIGTPIGDLDGERLLSAAQCRVIRHSPVQVRHFQQAGNHPCRLPQGQLKQHLDRQAELDRGIGKHRRATWAAVRRREPGHVLVQPDQQRPALAKRGSVAGPVRRAVAGD